MSESSDLVRRAYEAWNSDDLEAWLATMRSDAEFVTSGVFPDFDPVYRGHEGLADFWRRMHEPWETLRIDVEDVEEDGDSFVVAIRFRATGADSRIQVDMRFANAIRLRDGLGAEIIARPTPAEAWSALRSAEGSDP